MRVLSLLLLSSLATVVLMRCAPGYFDDAREMDAGHAGAVRAALQQEGKQSAAGTWAKALRDAAHLDFGTSRQYGTPVATLVRPRLATSLRLLLPSVLAGSTVALLLATLLAAWRMRAAGLSLGLVAAALCAVPISVLALFCLVSNHAGPAAVLFALVAARDFRFFARVLRRQAAAPHVFQARACGMPLHRVLSHHLLWPVRAQVLALLLTSFLVGLNAMLPVEVIFGLPGVGELAWSAAMNRDLPVLLAITMLVALCIATVGLLNPADAQARQNAGAAA